MATTKNHQTLTTIKNYQTPATMNNHQILTIMKNQIDRFHMLEAGDRVLIGLSGGADSICLTEALYLLAEEYQIHLFAVHCHHGIRGEEADEDALFARNFCEERKIPFFYVEEKVEEKAQREKISTEEAGRNFRYETFLHIMEQENCNKIAVAHNANDRAETMLFHLMRGTGLAGLSSMEPVRELSEGRLLIRPLLRVERTMIEQWISERNLLFRTDRTNLSDLYTRNRIRHHILPEMTQMNRQAVAHMGQTAEDVGEALGYLRFQEEEARKACIITNIAEKGASDGAWADNGEDAPDGAWADNGEDAPDGIEADSGAGIHDAIRSTGEIQVRVDKLLAFHPYLVKSVLYHCLARISEGRKDLERIHVSMLENLAKGESGRSLSFPGGVRVRKEYDRLIFYREEKQPPELSNLCIQMQKISFEGQEILKKKYTKFFDCDKIENGLRLRFWQPGDYLYLREDGGKKKLNRFFIDQKIPKEKRNHIPLLADGDHILWIVGYRISAYYKVTAETKNIVSVTIKNKG